MTSIRHNDSPAGVPGTSDAAPGPDDDYLDAARAAILAVGWSRTTLTDIARRAGVSRMTLYRRWPDTRTLLADLMTREWTRVVTASGVTEDAGDPLDLIARGTVATIASLRGNDLLRRIVEVDPDVLLPYLLERRGRSQELVVSALASLIERGQAAGSVRAGDPRLLARSLVLACHGFTLSAQTMADDSGDLSRLEDELDALVRRYLRP